MDLAAWANPAFPRERLRDELVCLPAGTCPLPGPSQFFSSMSVGEGKWFFLPHIHPCPEVPPSPLPLQEAKEGEGVGGQGSPSVLRLHRVFRLNQENFYYQKEKKKKKKSQRPPFLPAPLGQSRLDLWGSWEGGSGLEHSQARVVEFPGRPSARPTLGFSPLPTSFPSKQPTRGGLPLPPGPWATGLYAGAQWGTAQPWRGWAVGPWLPPYHILCSPSPELGISFHELLWGYSFPSSEVCAISHLSGRRKAGLTPVLGEGRGLGHGLSAPRGPLGNRDTGFSVLGVFV